MTKFDPSQIQWREPWWLLSQEEAERAAAELRGEMCAEHVLYGRPVQAIGVRQDRDDFLFYLGEAVPQFAVVHLTYQRETQPTWPSTKLFDTLDAWIEQDLNPSAEEFV